MGGRRFCVGEDGKRRARGELARKDGETPKAALARSRLSRGKRSEKQGGVLRAERWGNDRRRGAFARRGGERPQRMRLRAVCFSRGKEKRISRGALRAQRREMACEGAPLACREQGNGPRGMRLRLAALRAGKRSASRPDRGRRRFCARRSPPHGVVGEGRRVVRARAAGDAAGERVAVEREVDGNAARADVAEGEVRTGVVVGEDGVGGGGDVVLALAASVGGLFHDGDVRHVLHRQPHGAGRLRHAAAHHLHAAPVDGALIAALRCARADEGVEGEGVAA